MNIQKVTHNKKAYLDLFLLADEQENMIDKYLERFEDGKQLVDMVYLRRER